MQRLKLKNAIADEFVEIVNLALTIKEFSKKGPDEVEDLRCSVIKQMDTKEGMRGLIKYVKDFSRKSKSKLIIAYCDGLVNDIVYLRSMYEK